VVPVVHFYGRKELGYILNAAEPKVFITTDQFGRMEHHPDLCGDVPMRGQVLGQYVRTSLYGMRIQATTA
jgi:hypothetical protein